MTTEKQKRLVFTLTIIALTIYTVSVAILRHQETSTDDASALENLASTAMLLAFTIGPSLVAKELLLKLQPATLAAKECARLRRLVRTDERRCQRAVNAMQQKELYRDWHHQETQQITAVYVLAYREAGGTIPTPQVAATPRQATQKKDKATFHPFVRHLPTPLPNPYKGKKS